MSVYTTHVFDATVGAALLGSTVAFFLYGITTGQVILYLSHHEREWTTVGGRCYVVVIWILDTAHAMVLAYTIFFYAVMYHGDPTRFSRVLWAFGVMVMITESSNTLVRCGYAVKIWKYKNRKIIAPVIVATLAFVLLIMGTIFCVMEIRLKTFEQLAGHLQWNFYAAFALQLVIDAVIAEEMLRVCAKFHTGLSRLDRIVRTLIIYVINTGVFAMLLNTLSLVFYLALPGTYLYLATYWVLTKLHTCSLLGVLNAEISLAKGARQHVERTTSMMFTSAVEVEDVLTGLPPSQVGIEVPEASPPISIPSHLVEEVPLHRKSYDAVQQTLA